jgi:hemoglobin
MKRAIREEEIVQLVSTFYERARQDPLLGPIFARAVAPEAWPAHEERIARFWSTVLRGTGRYRANPIEPHRGLEGLTASHYERWLELFGQTARDIWSEEVAASVELRARRMADHMQRVLAPR